MATVLVVDDKEMMRDSVGATLERAGLEVVSADSGEAALRTIAARRPDAVVTDLKMPGMSGIELVERVRAIDDELPIVLMTAYATIETAVRALKVGAFDYLSKPFEGDELIIAVKRAVEHARLVRENAVLRSAAGEPAVPGTLAALVGRGGAAESRGIDRIVGASPAIRRVKEQVLAVAESHGTVLIVGESGTGKEVVARAVHECSERGRAAACAGVFLGVNCAALSESLLESELFGHERGAFTGADRTRKGRFELASGGTLLLDEISEISTRIQAKLLRVLQERVIERVGSSASIGVDVRVVATSNRDLPTAIARGEFRQDLFFRLNVLPIHLPPLRDRPEDIGALAEHFAARIAARDGRPAARITPEAIDVLGRYPWPGNVRELQNICERAVVLCQRRGSGEPAAITGDLIRPWLGGAWSPTPTLPLRATAIPLPAPQPPTAAEPWPAAHAHAAHANGSAPAATIAETKPAVSGDAVPIANRLLEDIERDAIVSTLRRFNGHRLKTAQALGIGVRTLGLKLKKWKTMNLVDAAI
ncbi:MAG: hypothetical protein C0475_05010 [Planctomyces sp.]|nr:hypothetical protein [Planctomyces sp.]MBA4038755.1 hypothetical protein [Planctomyces sp.]